MSAPDPLIAAYVVGLDLVPVQIAVTGAGVVIGRAPLTGVPPSQSVILHCRRHSNIERMMASVRFQFANVPTRATLSELVSAVLKSAEAFGVIILTETEVRIMATDAIAQMEAELAELWSAGGLPAVNRSVRNDTAAAEVGIPAWHAAMSWLKGWGSFMRGSSKAQWLVDLSSSISNTLAIVGPRLADAVWTLGECIGTWVARLAHLDHRDQRRVHIQRVEIPAEIDHSLGFAFRHGAAPSAFGQCNDGYVSPLPPHSICTTREMRRSIRRTRRN
jgi:hypothetical protein